MRIAALQFCPVLGDVAASIDRAERLLYQDESRLQHVDLLVLPELAFTGYNFPTLAAIKPYLEPTASGPSTAWAIKTARRLNCTVAVGYPERTLDLQHVYNALVFVSAAGSVLVHTRKSHLFYTDEVWAEEGPDGFFAGEVSLGPVREAGGGSGMRSGDGKAAVTIAAGICMDINPYQFTAPWTAYEFTTHARTAKAELVVLSCAWLTETSAEELRTMPTEPDLGTLGYWVERFSPLTGPAVGEGEQKEVVLAIANRVGDEGTAERVGEVRYAGTSCVLCLRKGDERAVRIWDILGRAEEGVLLVDTEENARFTLGRRTSGHHDEDGASTEGASTEDASEPSGT